MNTTHRDIKRIHEKRLFLKSIMVMALMLLLFALGMLIGSISVFAADINPGMCYSQNFTYFNQTTNSTTSKTFSACAKNCTGPSFLKLNITLYPGALKQYKNQSYNITAQCISNFTSQKCTATKTINPGEEYDHESGSCDIEVECRECDDDVRVCKTELPTEYTEKYRIYHPKDSQYIYLDFQDKHSQYDIDEDFDSNGELKFICPTVILNTSGAGRVTAEQCVALGHVYCGEAYNLQTKQLDRSRDDAKFYQDKLEDCRKEGENKVMLSTEEYASLKSQNLLVNNKSESCALEKGYKEYELNQEKDNKWFWMILALFLFAGNLWQWYNPKQLSKASKLGGVRQ